MHIKVVCRLGRQVSLYSSSQSPLSPSRLCPSPVLKSFSLRQHLPRGELVQPFHRAACASTSHLCNMRPVGLATPASGIYLVPADSVVFGFAPFLTSSPLRPHE